MEIQCPTGGTNVKVLGAGSGGAGTICARGTVVTAVRDAGSGLPVVIRVRVVAGEVTPPPPDPEPMQAGDAEVSPEGQDWLVAVPVPASGSAGVPSTLIAWEKVGSGSWSAPTSVWFNAGGSSPVDCCPAAGVGPPAVAFAAWPPPPPPLPPAVAGDAKS